MLALSSDDDQPVHELRNKNSLYRYFFYIFTQILLRVLALVGQREMVK